MKNVFTKKSARQQTKVIKKKKKKKTQKKGKKKKKKKYSRNSVTRTSIIHKKNKTSIKLQFHSLPPRREIEIQTYFNSNYFQHARHFNPTFLFQKFISGIIVEQIIIIIYNS